MSLGVGLIQNLLALACYDQESAGMVCQIIKPSDFDDPDFSRIAQVALSFYKEFNAPIGVHLPDALSAEIDKNPRLAEKIRTLVDLKVGINRTYILSRLQEHARRQALKKQILAALAALQNDDLDKAEAILRESRTQQVALFDPGIHLSDPKQALRFYDQIEEAWTCGIPALDKLGIGPSPKTLFLILGSTGVGKSFWLSHMGRSLLMQRKRVLFITLEMSEASTSRRHIQSLFSLAKTTAQNKVNKLQFDVDKLGYLKQLTRQEVVRPALDEPNMRENLTKKIEDNLQYRPDLIIKEFPTGSLTLQQLEAYMETLGTFEGFFPEVLIIDYADLMKVNPGEHAELTLLIQNLRGLAVRRNLALITASQGNRDAVQGKVLKGTGVTGSWGKIATSDTVVSINQTEEERKLNLARLFVDKARNERGKFLVIISQAYELGQFCFQSALMSEDYQQMVDDLAETDE